MCTHGMGGPIAAWLSRIPNAQRLSSNSGSVPRLHNPTETRASCLQARAALVLLVAARVLGLAAHVAPRALEHHQAGGQVDAHGQRGGGAEHLPGSSGRQQASDGAGEHQVDLGANGCQLLRAA